MKIGEQIRARQKQLKLDDAKVAAEVGVSEQTLRNWKSGRNYPSKKAGHHKSLEKALSFTIDWSEAESAATGVGEQVAAAHPAPPVKPGVITAEDVAFMNAMQPYSARAKELIVLLAAELSRKSK